MTDKKRIKKTDKDFKLYDVFIYGVKQYPVGMISADVDKREVWRWQFDDSGERAREELATGDVSIRRKAAVSQ